jgi:Family of unknown function (DUF6272)
MIPRESTANQGMSDVTPHIFSHNDLETIIRLYEATMPHKASFSYRGTFVDKFTNSILDISEGALSGNTKGSGMNRKLSFLLVECFQNLLKHGESDSNLETDGLFSFTNMKESFVINSINYIHQEEKARLKELVDHINSLDTKELKDLYMRQLNSGGMSAKGGAGLGLIELSRKSGQKLQYQIEDFNDKYAMFHQQVTLPLNEVISRLDINHIPMTEKMFARLLEESIFLYYKGDLSQKSILPMLDFVEHNAGGGSAMNNFGRKAGHVLVEMLQNISRHSPTGDNDERQGIFLIGSRGGKLIIQCGNMINHHMKGFIDEKLSYLNSLDKNGLAELHKSALKASLKFESKNRSGLGLIEIAKASCEKIHYTFQPFGENKYFFAVQVCI